MSSPAAVSRLIEDVLRSQELDFSFREGAGGGYSGIVVAMLANLNPLGVVLAALFTAIMFVGADGMSRSMGIPTYIADVTVALSLISMLIAVFFTQYRISR